MAGVAAATGGTATVTPSSGVTPSSTVSVSGSGITGSDAQPFSGLVALSQCGNADSSGSPLSSISASDCDGASQVAHIKFATVTSGSLPGTSFPIRESGIGNGNRQCLPVPPATLPCQIGVGDVATAGTNVQLSATYSLAGAPPETTTTTSGEVTTTTAVPTTTLAPPTTTTHTTTPPPATEPPTGGTGTQVAAGSVEVIPAAATTTTPPGSTLAMTGLSRYGWWILGIGVALVDLGYLAISSTWSKRRGLFGRAR
jgi:hypothetical protein